MQPTHKKSTDHVSPVLFLVFNRPDTTRLVFQAIRQYRPLKLYIAQDGSRPEKVGESRNVKEVKDIIAQVDWDCEVITLFRDQNLGCKSAIRSAIDWFFEHEEEGIILEDDCEPDQSFFTFCHELLGRYRHDTRVMSISGNNFQGGKREIQYSYYFSRYSHCWGWATWKRAWQFFDGEISTWPDLKSKHFLRDIGGYAGFVNYWTNIFDNCYSRKIDSWAYPWLYSCWTQSGFSILPHTNLVSNIGFGVEATHTKACESKLANIPTTPVITPLQHPPYMIRNDQADRYTEENIFGIAQKPATSVSRFLKKLQKKVQF